MAFIAILSSCSSAPKEVPYFVEAETIPESMLAQINPYVEPFIIPGDLLDIQVTATNMKSVMSFNKGLYLDEKGEVAQLSLNRNMGGGSSTNSYVYYYLVGTDGCIDFPIVGKIKVGGMKTKSSKPSPTKSCPSMSLRSPQSMSASSTSGLSASERLMVPASSNLRTSTLT